MSTNTVYEQLRGHLHYLKLAAVADALAPALVGRAGFRGDWVWWFPSSQS
jgi:hypothetical protein